MKALEITRSLPRFAAARVASHWRSGEGGRFGPLRLADIEPPERREPGWLRVRPRLAGICGSDLATVDGRSSRWFEPIVTFPFVPGHEVVGELDDGRRVVIEPVLACPARGVDPPCAACGRGERNRCEQLVGGHLRPGLQTGYCGDVGGGWSIALQAHESQLHPVPDGWTDEAAVLVEPTACAVHGALATAGAAEPTAVVIGAGTLGLATVAALRRFRTDVATVACVAKHPEQRRLARTLGADVLVEPDEVRRAARRLAGGAILANGQLTSGVPLVIDCVGSARSLADALAIAAPGATVVLLGMPGHLGIDLTPLWQRELRLAGSYAYGPEPASGGRHSFDLAGELVVAAELEQLVSARYRLDRYAEAIAHAADAGRRGSVKIVFDLRAEKRR